MGMEDIGPDEYPPPKRCNDAYRLTGDGVAVCR